MLKNLKISNFALIKDIDVNFDPKFTAITGATGAGKSILLDGLFLLFGKRGQTHMIRSGYDYAEVEGTFLISNELKEEFELDNEIIVRRKIDKNSKNEIFLNDKLITLSYLKQIMDNIGVIQTQNDLFKLLDPNSYIEFLDALNHDIYTLKNDYLIKRSIYLDALKELKNLRIEKQQAIAYNDILEFQMSEINNLNLQLNEKELLVTEYEQLKNYDAIYYAMQESSLLLEESLLSQLGILSNSISKISNYHSDYQVLSNTVDNSLYQLEDVKSEIFKVLNSLDFDQNRFDFINQRILEIEKIEKKYQKTGNELLNHLENLTATFEKYHDFDAYILKQETKVQKLKEDSYKAGLLISKQRQVASKLLTKEVLLILSNLSLEHTKFEIDLKQESLDDTKLSETGIDIVEFNVSFNEGEQPLELAKIASGGERARFMYALKTVEAKANNNTIIVFDEIDMGISGKVAGQMASHMQNIAKHLQIITITHLPQVAAKANMQLSISKVKKGARMETVVSELTFVERISAIAVMLSDEEVTPYAIEQAKSLLK